MSCNVTWCDYAGDLPEKKDPVLEQFQWEIVLGTFSQWFSNEILGIARGETPVVPTQMYVAVHSTVCTSATPGTELSGDGYARVPVTFERVSDIQSWNNALVNTPSATADWTVASFSLWDSQTIGGGNYYAFGNLPAAITIATTKAVSFPANNIIMGTNT